VRPAQDTLSAVFIVRIGSRHRARETTHNALTPQTNYLSSKRPHPPPAAKSC
jgi:hypothetical protein